MQPSGGAMIPITTGQYKLLATFNTGITSLVLLNVCWVNINQMINKTRDSSTEAHTKSLFPVPIWFEWRLGAKPYEEGEKIWCAPPYFVFKLNTPCSTCEHDTKDRPKPCMMEHDCLLHNITTSRVSYVYDYRNSHTYASAFDIENFQVTN